MNFVQGVKDGFKEFGERVTSVVNFVLLLIVYVIGVGITTILAKITKQKLLDFSFKDGRDSYWVDHKEEVDYTKQF
ncbi:hypothetical protein HOD83_02455 [Candidatus Woesearchaeota archaeon]|jgi:hypothetical protein|nr:hypothetical protein [Candidatus Woesearchaeota archaeon]MBT4114129.1 hypothetical protein [Candidatus Woesearchaeota archaeon]MBT4248428.1 hypothetical protein [Candidatus Woesearchaeota archaeon]